MLRKIVANVLLILTVLPFTAPFATCDAATLFGDQATLVPHQVTLAPSVEDSSHGVPALMSSGRLGIRIKFISRLETDAHAHRLDVPALGADRSAAASPRLPGHASLTALRI